MYEIQYLFVKIKSKVFKKNPESVNNYFRKKGIKIGIGTKLYSNIMTPEPYLITLGKNVTISNDVQFITHDNSVSKILPDYTDVFGKIIIGDNCFIGAKSIILYGCELTDNIIVAAGSVVTKSFNEKNIIIAGNPAKKISKWDDFRNKMKEYCLNVDGLDKNKKLNLLNNSKILFKKRYDA
jgi:acetyltransferase-like isoleucine patch superfamily enzyme